MSLSKSEAHRRVAGLRRTLEGVVKRDPEQEVQGMALPVVDACFEAARQHLKDDDPLRRVATEIITPEMISEASDEPLRAVDALVVAQQLEDALFEMPRATVSRIAPRSRAR